MENAIIKALNNRYATKKFDSTKKLSQNQIDVLTETARLTATSFGLQLMKLVIVENPEIRKELVKASYGQLQVVESSHLLVLCREKELNLEQIENYIQNISKTRNQNTDELDSFRNSMAQNLMKKPKEELEKWMEKQVYIALGNLMSSCAMMGIDSCPIEGFQPKEYDRILGLNNLNLTSVLVLPVGHRSDEDHHAHHQKVRRSNEDFIVKIN